MIYKDLKELFKSLNLSDINEEPERITGGLLHTMMKVKTDESTYAVKHLNPIIMKREKAYSDFIFSEKFARFAHKNNIKSIAAIVIAEEVVHIYKGNHYLIFPWLEGETIKDIKLDQARKIGLLLADIHLLNYKTDIEKESAYELSDWNSYLKVSEEEKSIWLNEYKNNLEYLKNLEIKAVNSLKENPEDVISHRDLDPKNVMWDKDKNPVVIDWESAGPVSSTVELLEVALDWSESFNKKDNFKMIIESYKSKKNVDIRKLKEAVYSINYNKLKWLEYNIKRSLKIESSNKEEEDLGTKEVISTLKNILEFSKSIAEIEKYLDKL